MKRARVLVVAFADDLGHVLMQLPGFAAVGLARYRTSPPFLRLNERALQVLTAAVGAGGLYAELDPHPVLRR